MGKKKPSRSAKPANKPAAKKSERKASKHASPKSPKRRRFVKGLVAGKSMRRAALDAGYTQAMADNAGQKILPGVRSEFREALALAIPISHLVKRIAEGLNSHETKLAQFEGTFVDQRTLVSWGERRRYAELAAKLLGYLVDRLELTGEAGGPIELADARERLLAQLAR